MRKQYFIRTQLICPNLPKLTHLTEVLYRNRLWSLYICFLLDLESPMRLSREDLWTALFTGLGRNLWQSWLSSLVFLFHFSHPVCHQFCCCFPHDNFYSLFRLNPSLFLVVYTIWSLLTFTSFICIFLPFNITEQL